MYTLIALLLLFTSCCRPQTESYRQFYSHLNELPPVAHCPTDSEAYLIIFLEARHLDYTDNYSFLKTLAKHPSDGSKNRDVGHAWIYLQGQSQEGELLYFYGGHSGETGLIQAKYFDGIMNYIDYGDANPSNISICSYEPNPVKYLFETQRDGFLQWGSGRHKASFAAKIDLTDEQFERVLQFVMHYPYHEYAITGNQCSSFVAHAASLAGLDLECEVTVEVEPCLVLGADEVCLWKDPAYRYLTISSPDMLEKSLIEAVRQGKAVRIK